MLIVVAVSIIMKLTPKARLTFDEETENTKHEGDTHDYMICKKIWLH
jgi:hypothetical protein